jgi:polysaccharide pyruvyl transferase WcaK-like protein
MKKRIAIINFDTRLQRGQEAQLFSRMSILRETIPNIEFIVFAYHDNYAPMLNGVSVIESPIQLSTLVKFLKSCILLSKSVLWYSIYHLFKHDLRLFLNDNILKEMRLSDIVIDIGGDTLTEDYGHISFMRSYITHLFPILLDRPLVIYGETIGPFSWFGSRSLMRWLLSHTKLITVRESASALEIENLGIRKPVYITADSAFIMKPAEIAEVMDILDSESIQKKDSPFIGISVSRLISQYGFRDVKGTENKYMKYVTIMAQFADSMIDITGASLIFIDHVTDPNPKYNDRTVSNDIYELMNMKSRVKLIKGDYSAMQLKGIIGQCQLFIGSRLHSLIAATSMGVPTVAISYSRKTTEIIGKMLKQDKYMLNIEDLDYLSLLKITEDAWSNRGTIRHNLAPLITQLQSLCRYNAELVKGLLYDPNNDFLFIHD